MSSILSYYNRVIQDGPTITANSEADAYPVSNLALDSVVDIYRSTDDAAEWIKFNFGAAKAFKIILIPRFHNLTSAATVTMEFNGADAWGDPAESEVLAVTAGKAVCAVFDHEYQWARLTIVDDDNPDGYIEIPYIWLGEHVTLSSDWADYRRGLLIPGVTNASTIHTSRGYKAGAQLYHHSGRWEIKAGDIGYWRSAYPYAFAGPILVGLNDSDLDDETYLVNWQEAKAAQQGGALWNPMRMAADGGVNPSDMTFVEVGAGLDQEA